MVTVGYNPSTGKVQYQPSTGKVCIGCCGEENPCPKGPCPRTVTLTVSGISICAEPYTVCEGSPYSPGFGDPNQTVEVTLAESAFDCSSVNATAIVGDWIYFVSCNSGFFGVRICSVASTQDNGRYTCFYVSSNLPTIGGSVTFANVSASSASCQTGSCSSAVCNPGHIVGYGGNVVLSISCSDVGAWATGISYSEHNITKNASVCYTCILGHTSGSSNRPGVGVDWETYWDEWT